MREKVALKENVSLIINIKSAHYTLYFHHISRDLNKILLKSLNKNNLHYKNAPRIQSMRTLLCRPTPIPK